MSCDKVPAQFDPGLVAQQTVKDGIGLMQRIDQAHLIGVAIDRESIRSGKRRRVHDCRAYVAVLAQQIRLHFSLQCQQRIVRARRPSHAACREWRASGPRDIGLLTNRALASDSVTAWMESGRNSCGNGGLMRAAASVAAGSSGDALLHEAAQLSAITHADPRSIAACVIFCAGLESLSRGALYADAWLSAIESAARLDIERAVQFLGAPYARETATQWPAVVASVATFVRKGLAPEWGGNSGFALTTLQTAIVQGASPTFAEGTLRVVRAGDDSDTVAAVTGAILAARGLLPPAEWLTTLRCGERWSAWPTTAIGPACVARLEEACLRASGV